jgi:hypothetical protein
MHGRTYDYVSSTARAGVSGQPAERRSPVRCSAGACHGSPSARGSRRFAKLMGRSTTGSSNTARSGTCRHRGCSSRRKGSESTSINAISTYSAPPWRLHEWRDLAYEGWGYDDVLPYYIQSTTSASRPYHGTRELNVTDQWATPFRGVPAGGPGGRIPYTADRTAPPVGVFYHQHPARCVARERGDCLPASRVRKRRISRSSRGDGEPRGRGARSCRGRLLSRGADSTWPARGSSSAPAPSTPGCCSLSGIGPADELRAAAWEVVHDLPRRQEPARPTRGLHHGGVDAAHQLHCETVAQAASTDPVGVSTGQSAMATITMGRLREQHESVRSPDIHCHFLPAYSCGPTSRAPRHGSRPRIHHPCLQRPPRSRGESARSADRTSRPSSTRTTSRAGGLDDLRRGLPVDPQDPRRAGASPSTSAGADAGAGGRVGRRDPCLHPSVGKTTTTRSARAGWARTTLAVVTRSSACMGSTAAVIDSSIMPAPSAATRRRPR